MRDLDRYFDILEIAPGASFEEIKRAYRDLVKVWHPDRFPNDARLRARAEERTKALNEAYRVLCTHNDEIASAVDNRVRPRYESPPGRPPSGTNPPRRPTQSPQAERNNRVNASGLLGWIAVGAVVTFLAVIISKGELSDWAIPSRQQASRGAAVGAGYVIVDLVEWAVRLARPTVRAGIVPIWVHNGGTIEHNLVVKGTRYRIEALPVGDARTLTALLGTGTYRIVCDIPGHREAGMTGVLFVR